MAAQRALIGPLYKEVDGVLLRRCSGYGPKNIQQHYTKPTQFPRSKASLDGYDNRCKSCNRAGNSVTNLVHTYRNSPEYEHYSDASKYSARHDKYRHKKKGLPYDKTLTRELVWECGLGLCHICHKPVLGPKWVAEHVDGEDGWLWYNIRVAHPRCNNSKNSTSMEELEARGVLDELRSTSYIPERLMLTDGR